MLRINNSLFDFGKCYASIFFNLNNNYDSLICSKIKQCLD